MSAALRPFVLVSVLGASAAPALAQMKLNPPLARPSGGDIREFAVSPHGRRVVYRADQERDEVFELYSVRPSAAGKVTVKINAPLVEAGDVRAFRITPDGERVLYAADQETPGRVELWSVPIDGGLAVRISTPGATLAGSPTSASFVQIDVDGTRVAFLQRAGTQHALFGAPLDGGAAPVQLSALATATRPIRSDFRVDSTGEYVVYRVDQDQLGVVELWSAPMDGGAPPAKLNAPLTQGGVDPELAFTAGGERVVFRATDPADGRDALWSAAPDGLGIVVRLDGPRGPEGVLGGFVLDPQHGLVVYAASTSAEPGLFALHSVPVVGQVPPTALTDFAEDSVGAFRVGAGRAVFTLRPGAGGDSVLYSVPTDGSEDPQLVDSTLVAGGSVLDDLVLTSDGHGLAFVADRSSELAIFTAPTDAGTPPIHVDTLGGNALLGGLEFSSDSGSLVYVANARDPDTFELLGVPSDGSRPRAVLSGAIVFGGDVQDFELAPFAPIVVYRADAAIDGVHSLYAVPASGALPTRELNEPLPVGPIEGDVLQVELVGDGSLALYLATQEEADKVELYAVETTPRGRAYKLNGTLVPGGNVSEHRVSLAAGRVVYLADQDSDDVDELYSAPLDGSAPAVRISRNLAPGGDVLDFELVPDGLRAVYLADAREDGVVDLYVVPIDGLGTNQRLNTGAPAAGIIDLASVEFTPDNAYVAYFGDQETDERYEVFVAPLDASDDPVSVSGPMVAGGDVLIVQPMKPFRLTPDGLRVVYVADALVDGVFELFSAPLGGGADPVRLSGSMVAGGSVRAGFELTPDGARVVYVADALTNGVDELFVAPVDGSEPPRRLNSLLFSGGKVWRFQVVPDGSRVLYLSDQNVRGVVELFSVPLTGGPPIRLNEPFGPRADIASAFEPMSPLAHVTPSGTHVVYRADRDIDELDEVYVVPLDGSAAPLELNEPFGAPAFRTARRDVVIGSDSRHVLYRAAPHGAPTAELFRVPIDGRRPPMRLAGGVESYALAADGTRAVYLADEGAGAFELYLTLLDHPRRTAERPGRTVAR